MKRLTLTFCFILLETSFAIGAGSHIRINQLGYLEKDTKRAIIGSYQDLEGQTYLVRNLSTDKVALTGNIGSAEPKAYTDTPFPFNHIIDFTKIEASSFYQIELQDKTTSHNFVIGNNVYKNVIDTLLYFLKVARCGNTNPELHQACHLHDATNTDYDLTGGWHDAGDFLKFTHDEAYVTYTLLLSYEINKDKYVQMFNDLNQNGLVDVLEEAKIGLDYLVKVYPDENTFIYQVGNFDQDHNQGFRMPEEDKLTKTDRPALFGFNRNALSQYAFAMALGSNLFGEIPGYQIEAQKYLNLAKRAYVKAKTVGSKDIDKLCLAAAELYRVTKEDSYLE
jgi:hypothetical protein